MRAFILAVLAVTACTAPSQHDSARYGTVRVAFDVALDDAGPWRSDQLVELRHELAALSALGPTLVEVDPCAPVVDVTVRPFDSGPGCTLGAGRFHPGSHYVECDPACAPGFPALRSIMAHEIGHFLGMSHVCRQNEASDCSSVGNGPAVMNPFVIYGDTDVSFDSAFTGDDLTDTPTDLDLAEYRAVHP